MIERIGTCRILEEIGSGGMAVIYKAVQETLNRTVAVKALKASIAPNSQFAVRFEREALSVSSLQHENIIHVYDFVKVGDQQYIVMEFVEGIDLYDLLEKAPTLDPSVAAIVAMQVARALDYAHYRGIIHRDIKPANIMIGKSGVVKLMDFGIARDQNFSDLTEQGTGLGTPSYMSPEQIVGDKLDFRSDIFSLGIVLYQMVCGRKPFLEDDNKSVMHKIRLEKHAPARKINPSIPRELERILQTCLEKKKEDRFRSTQDLVLALERFVSRRVEMNYHARIVLFLREQGLISDAEADAQLHPALAGGYRKPEVEGPLGPGGLRRLAKIQASVAGAIGVMLAFVHVSQIGSPPQVAIAQAAQPAQAPPPGYLRVLAEPWADVYVDGKIVETTPFAKAIAIPEGTHKLVLRNPKFGTDERALVVKRGETTLVKVQLKK